MEHGRSFAHGASVPVGAFDARDRAPDDRLPIGAGADRKQQVTISDSYKEITPNLRGIGLAWATAFSERADAASTS
jgi:hypothetical protein